MTTGIEHTKVNAPSPADANATLLTLTVTVWDRSRVALHDVHLEVPSAFSAPHAQHFIGVLP